ncbi:hypothetical protein [uncultured Methanolobus sp.]|uniref:hypothetical protein n=1 Tax=uncultured Methanolobus sp. TaxID=218300 RepID=UPI002AABA7E5|nr:hypothetical protein [uncultured Methanolobus sp.]
MTDKKTWAYGKIIAVMVFILILLLPMMIIDERMQTMVIIVVPATLLFLAFIAYSVRRNVKAKEGEYTPPDQKIVINTYMEELAKEHKKIGRDHSLIKYGLILLLVGFISLAAAFFLNCGICFIISFFILFPISMLFMIISSFADASKEMQANRNATNTTIQKTNDKEMEYVAKHENRYLFYFIVFFIMLCYVVFKAV